MISKQDKAVNQSTQQNAILNQTCVLCANQGRTSQIRLYKINFEESVVLCSYKSCTYPYGVDEFVYIRNDETYSYPIINYKKKKAPDLPKFQSPLPITTIVKDLPVKPITETVPIIIPPIADTPVSLCVNKTDEIIKDEISKTSLVSNMDYLIAENDIDDPKTHTGNNLKVKLANELDKMDITELAYNVNLGSKPVTNNKYLKNKKLLNLFVNNRVTNIQENNSIESPSFKPKPSQASPIKITVSRFPKFSFESVAETAPQDVVLKLNQSDINKNSSNQLAVKANSLNEAVKKIENTITKGENLNQPVENIQETMEMINIYQPVDKIMEPTLEVGNLNEPVKKIPDITMEVNKVINTIQPIEIEEIIASKEINNTQDSGIDHIDLDNLSFSDDLLWNPNTELNFDPGNEITDEFIQSLLT